MLTYQQLLEENRQLRAELLRQWELLHDEMCTNMETHTGPGPCYWPKPAILTTEPPAPEAPADTFPKPSIKDPWPAPLSRDGSIVCPRCGGPVVTFNDGKRWHCLHDGWERPVIFDTPAPEAPTEQPFKGTRIPVL